MYGGDGAKVPDKKAAANAMRTVLQIGEKDELLALQEKNPFSDYLGRSDWIDAVRDLVVGFYTEGAKWEEKEFLFRLCRRLKWLIQAEGRTELDEADKFSFAKLLRFYMKTGKVPVENEWVVWEDDDQLQVSMEETWLVVRYAEGEQTLPKAIALAKEHPKENIVGPAVYRRYMSVFAYLQELTPGEPVFLAISTETERALGIPKPLQSRMRKRAVREGLLRPVAKGKAHSTCDTFHFVNGKGR